VSASPQHGFLAAAVPNTTSSPVAAGAGAGDGSLPARSPDLRTLGRLASLVHEVANQVEPPRAREPLPAVIAECAEVLEGCLQAQRDAVGRDESMMTTKDELARLARLLTVVDRADLGIVLRQIRRVLGRFDVHAG
jgi:hypothetical protein